MKRILLTALVAAVLASPPFALDRAHFVELNKKGREQAKQQDWKGLRATLIEIGQAMPAPTPVYLLRMASVETHLGNRPEAIGWLQKYAAMGLKYDLAGNEDLKPLLGDAAFRAVAGEMQARTKPVQRAEAVCTIPLPDLMPADLTFDKAAGTLIFSSSQHLVLYRITLPKGGGAECGVKELPLEDQAKRWPVLAVSSDPQRNLLWMTSCAMPDFTGFPKDDEGKAS